jgi:hypothetical protein
MEAVLAIRQIPKEGVWIDKLCINQDDTADRRRHIGVIDAIYRSARRVVILLEDVQLNKDEEAAGLTYAGFYKDLCREVADHGLDGEEKNQFIAKYMPCQEQEFRDNGTGEILTAAQSFAVKILSAVVHPRLVRPRVPDGQAREGQQPLVDMFWARWLSRGVL